MFTRRSFLRSVGSATTMASLASLREGGIERILAASRSAGATSPDKIAADEDFWREIQQAFTVDRSLINLNNGGVSPSPRVVQDAMRRYLEFSNSAPTITMWQVLEPEIESLTVTFSPGDAPCLEPQAYAAALCGLMPLRTSVWLSDSGRLGSGSGGASGVSGT